MNNAYLEARITELEHRLIRHEQLIVALATMLDSFDSEEETTEVWTSNETERATIRRTVFETITHFEQAYGESTPIDYVIEELTEQGHETDDIRDVIDALHDDGLLYKPQPEHMRVV